MARYTRKKIKDNPERRIALGMIVSDDYLKNVQVLFKPELIDTPFILTVVDWCNQYYEKFNTCPGVHIEDIYEKKVKNGDLQEEEEELIADLLDSISEEYDRSSNFNSEYLLDETEKYFETQNLKKRTNNVRAALANNDLELARKELSDYKPVQRIQTGGIDPFTNTEIMQKAFEYSEESLFKVPGAAGEFLNDMFVKDSFVTLLGPEKRGKTWWLIELSKWARRSGRNVAFFAAGDMTLPQMVLRYGISFCGKSNKPKYCGKLRVPVMDCFFNQNDSCEMKHRAGTFGVLDSEGKKIDDEPDYVPCTYCRKNPNPKGKWKGAVWYKYKEPVNPLSWGEASEKGKMFHTRWGKKSRFKLAAYANETLSIGKIENQLDLWESEKNFIPDIIIVDYMDLLIPDKIQSGTQHRHIINSIWGGARRISQERHCLFLSASQSDTMSYNVQWINMKHFSESKTKNAHVTGIVTLNQTMEEKRWGIMRLGKLLTREDEFDAMKGVTVLQSIATGKPLIDSYV